MTGKRIYLDHASATPVDPRVVEFAQRYLRADLANPSSQHSGGRRAKEALEEARKRVAELINAEDPGCIVFTGGATEAINMAIRGTALRNADRGRRVACSAIEHIAVFNSMKDLTKNGFAMDVLPVDSAGIVDLDKLAEKVRSDTIVTSVMIANGEIGTIEPIAEISRVVHEMGRYFHADATAAAGKVPIDVQKDGIDLLTLSSNDLGGPQGAGALHIKPGVKLQTVMPGGGQERGLRSGTENLFAIVGMGEAARIAKEEMPRESARLKQMRNRLIDEMAQIEGAHLTGHRTVRLPHHVSFVFEGLEGESIVMNLDAEYNIQVATGSACSAQSLQPSHVLRAIGLDDLLAHSSILMTLGQDNRSAEIPEIIRALKATVGKMQGMLI